MSEENTNSFALKSISIHDLFSEQPQEPEWTITDFLPNEPRTLIAGPPKSGKTQLTWEIVHTLTTGSPLFGRFKLAGGAHAVQNCLLIVQENSKWSVYKYFAEMMRQAGLLHWGLDHDDEPMPVLDVPVESMGKLDFIIRTTDDLRDAEKQGQLAELLVSGGYDWIVLDPAYALWPGMSYNDERETGKLLALLSKIAFASETNIVLVHHSSSKPGKREDIEASVLGSTLWTAWYDSFVGVNKIDNTEMRQIVRKYRDHETPPAMLGNVHGPGDWRMLDVLELDDIISSSTSAQKTRNRRRDVVRYWMVQVGGWQDLTKTEIVRRVKAAHEKEMGDVSDKTLIRDVEFVMGTLQ